MANNNLDGLSEEQLRRAESIKDSFVELRSATREANGQLRQMGEALVDFGGSYRAISSSANKVAAIQAEAAKSTKAVGQALAEQAKNTNEVARLNTKINDLYDRASRSTGTVRDQLLAQAKNLANARDNAQELSTVYSQIAESAANVDKSTAFFNGLSNVVSDIPGLRMLSGPFQDAAKAARETVISNAKNGKNISVMGAGMKGFAKSALSSATSFLKSGGYIGLIVMGLKKVWDIMMQADQASARLAGSLNMSKQEAANLSKEITLSAEGMNYLTQRIGAAQKLMSEFADSTGIISTNTDIFNHHLDAAQRRLGLSGEQTATIAKEMLKAGVNAEDFIEGVLGGAEAMEMQLGTNIQMQAIMKDVAGLTAAQTYSLGKNPGLIGQAVAKARSLGLTFTQLETTMGGLLDFESSITSEVEAEVLLNKQLNLERARTAALNNDYATVASEIAKQIGTAADFSKMNRFQQEALAKAVGMTRDDLAKTLREQEALAAAGYESAEARQEEYERLKSIYGEQQALKMIGDKQFETQQKNVSFQEKMNNLVENLKTIFMTQIEPFVASFLGYLESSNDSINRLIDKFKDLTSILKGIGQIVNATMIQPLKVVGNAVMTVVKLVQAAYQASNFQFGAAKESAAQAVDYFTGTIGSAFDIGTGLIAGIGTMAGAKDLNATGISDAIRNNASVSNKFKEEAETNRLLREIVEQGKKNKDIYIGKDKITASVSSGKNIKRPVPNLYGVN